MIFIDFFNPCIYSGHLRKASLMFRVFSQQREWYCGLLVPFSFFNAAVLPCRCCTKRIWGQEPQHLSLLRLKESNAIKRTLAWYFLIWKAENSLLIYLQILLTHQKKYFSFSYNQLTPKIIPWSLSDLFFLHNCYLHLSCSSFLLHPLNNFKFYISFQSWLSL